MQIVYMLLKRLPGMGWCVAATLLVSACSDADGGSLALPVAVETQGAILFSEDFPTLPTLLLGHGLAEEGALETESWSSSWDLDEDEGAELRSRIRPLAARRLLPALGPAGVQELLGRIGLSMLSVEALTSYLDSRPVEEALESARAFHLGALRASEVGQWEEALTLALGTTDALWQVTPRQVAKSLIRQAETTLGRKQGIHAYSQEELTRIRRLMYGASEALEAGDYPGAIRRAYYACQLLGANPP